MDWLRSEDLKEEKNVTAPIVIIAVHALCRFEEAAARTILRREIKRQKQGEIEAKRIRVATKHAQRTSAQAQLRRPGASR